MGFENLVEDKTPDDAKSSGSGSGSSSGSTQDYAHPNVTFVRDRETGELEVRKDQEAIWEDQSFHTEKVEFIIRDDNMMMALKDRVKRHTRESLTELINDDPEKALKILKQVRHKGSNDVPAGSQTCPVCDDKINPLRHAGDYERVGHKLIHRSHTVADLAEADLIGEIERDWDFVESQYRNR